jgi:hypothetical protein
MNASDIKFRCSGLYSIMTHEKATELQKGHITQCRKTYRSLRFDREPEYITKYTEKGVLAEEDGITLLSRYLFKLTGNPVVLKKNDERVENEWISGHPDCYMGESITAATAGFDIKCSWDIHSFPMPDEKLDPSYEWQNRGYMWLTGAKKWSTAYCLVNAPAYMITREKEKVWYSMGQPSEDNERFIEHLVKIEKNMIFDMVQFRKENPNTDLEVLNRDLWKHDMPLEARVLLFTINRDTDYEDRIKSRVELCRNYILNNLIKK